jgi:hypothetical protein
MIPMRIPGRFIPPIVLLVACSSKPAWQDLDPEALTTRQSAQVAKAKGACQSLGDGLKSRLTAAISKDGAIEAIDVCRVAAGEITQRVATQQGLRIGRTSHRLRNPANAAPEWARPAVAAKTSKVILRSGPLNQLGALIPIPMAGLCVTCHGPPASIATGVREALTEHYPADQATGFAPGELRGWFWVEVQD